jgi:hypothetical protein
MASQQNIITEYLNALGKEDYKLCFKLIEENPDTDLIYKLCDDSGFDILFQNLVENAYTPAVEPHKCEDTRTIIHVFGYDENGGPKGNDFGETSPRCKECEDLVLSYFGETNIKPAKR